MSKRPLAVLALVAGLYFGTPALLADKGDKDQKHQHGNKHNNDDDDRGWERRDGYEYRVYSDHDGRPPGWSHGKKTGWKNCGMHTDDQEITSEIFPAPCLTRLVSSCSTKGTRQALRRYRED